MKTVHWSFANWLQGSKLREKKISLSVGQVGKKLTYPPQFLLIPQPVPNPALREKGYLKQSPKLEHHFRK